MSLIKLKDKFEDQRTHNDGFILVSASVLESVDLHPDQGLDESLQGYLRLNDVLKVHTKEAIPDPEDNKLTFGGTAFFLDSEYSTNPNVLTPQEYHPKKVELTFQTEEKTNNVHFLLIYVSTKWTFQDSFPWLPDYPFNSIEFLESRLVFSSQDEEASYDWKTPEKQEGHKVILRHGLNFMSEQKIGGAIALLKKVLRGKTDTLVFSGTIDPRNITSSPESQSSTSHTVLFPQIDLSAPFTDDLVELPWFNLTMKSPKVLVETVDDEYGQSFWLTFMITLVVNGKDLTVESAILENWNQFEFQMGPADKSQSITSNDILQLIGGNDFQEGIPDVLKSAFEKIGLRGLNTTFDVGKKPRVSNINLAVGATKSWELNSQFTIKDIVLHFFLFNPISKPKPRIVTFSATLSFFSDVFPEDFIIDIQHRISSNSTTITGQYLGEVSLRNILRGIAQGSATFPDKNFPNIVFSDFGLQLDKEAKDWGFRFYGSANVAYKLGILGKEIEANFSIDFSKSNSTVTVVLTGGLSLANAYFSFTINLSEDSKVMQASWFQLGEPLGLNDLAHSLGFDDFSIPEELDLGLTAASFTYNFSEKIFSLTADSETWGKVTLSSVRDKNNKSQLIFFCHLPESKDIDGGILPLVGDELKGNLKLSDLRFLISTADFESISVDILEGSSTSTVELSNVKRGITFMSELTLGSDVQELTIPIYQPKIQKKTLELEASNELTVDPPQPENLGGASRVGKSLGPFNFREFGVSLKSKTKLTFQLDASLITAGLEIHLNDLGLAFSPVEPTNITPSLKGLSVQFTGGPVSIAGGLVNNSTDELQRFDGQLTISLKKLMISALGSYAKTENDLSSLFVFAMIDYPLGGPPFFFVTGGTIGFGYNRELVIPAIDGVHEFPLIQAALGSSDFEKGNLANNLEQMLPVIPVKEGQNWLGLGVKFRSFNLVNGFVLTTLSFGNQTEAHILGLATAQIPFTGKKPIAYIEMALLASFIPDKGVVSIEGALTDRSFLFSEQSKLTGGFAFYLWFDGEHAGDFVLTAGGYHPTFNIPDYYPKPQKIGVNWQITPQLSITGESYFALTPAAIMAGGLLNCQWKSDSLQAWFLLGFDFIISWQPFYYDAAVYASIGVSTRVKVFWVRKTVTVHVGANIHIWGPEFSGQVKVKLWFVSFTISFGAKDKPQIGPITWTEFKEACLPSLDNILSLQVSKGLIKDVAKETDVEGNPVTTDVVDWIVDPANLVLEINSLIPIKKFAINKVSGEEISEREKLEKEKLEKPNIDFGVAMVRIPSTDFTSVLNVTLTKEGETKSLTSRDFIVEPVIKSVPASMWKYDGPKDDQPKVNDPLVKGVLTGLIIRPITSSPDKTVPVAIVFLEASAIHVPELNFGDSDIQPTNPLSQKDAMHTMIDTISGDATIDTARNSILSALATWDKNLSATVDLSRTKSSAETYWTAAPILSELGYETPANP